MDFLKYSKIYFFLSGFLILFSLILILKGKVKLGMEFTGGTILQVEFKENFEISEIEKNLSKILGQDYILQKIGEKGISIKTKEFSEKKKDEIVEGLKKIGEFKEGSFEIFSLEPMIGRELKKSSIFAIILAAVLILFYIAFAFKKSFFKENSFKYSFSAIIALFHDVLIATGISAFIGLKMGFEVGIPFVAALLTIFGYSINDTIVIFDRLRENLLKKGKASREIFNLSLRETILRSLFTSLTTLLALFCLFFWGTESLFPFTIVLIIGIVVGTYSSIFIATPILYQLIKK